MKNFRINSVSFVLALILHSAFCILNCSAGGPGGRSGEFLLFGKGSRAFGMGGAVTSLPAGAFSLHNNPAGLGLMDLRELSLDYNRWVSDVTHQSVLYGHPRRRHAWGFGLMRQGVADFQGYDAGGQVAEDVSADDLVASVGWAKFRKMGKSQISFGIGAKWIQSRLEKSKASGLAADLGTVYQTPLPFATLGFGFSAQNLGPALKYDSEDSKLPTSYRFGISAQRRFYGDMYTLAADVVRPDFDSGRLNLGVGLEGTVRGLLVPRIGFEMPHDLGNGFSFGLGLRIKALQVDYAVSLLETFGPTHRLGFTTRWGQPTEVSRAYVDIGIARAHQKLGKEYMSKGRFIEAIHEFSKALEYDPTNKDIMRDMEKAFEANK